MHNTARGGVFSRTVTGAALAAAVFLGAHGQASAQGTPHLVSLDSGGAQAAGASGNPSISADGRYVAFESTAANLVPGDTNNSSDIFVKDRWTGAITRVSVKSDGSEATGDSITPRLTPDARYVVFASRALLGEAGAPGSGNGDIFLHDRTTGATTLVSLSSTGTPASGGSDSPSISADARYLTFRSTAPNLADGANIFGTHIFLRDRTAGTTIWLDRQPDGRIGIPTPGPPTISSDGSTVGFTWYGPYYPLPPGVTDAPCQDHPVGFCARVFIFDRPHATLSRLPLDSGLFSVYYDVQVGAVALSADGRMVASDVITRQTVQPSLLGPPPINESVIVQDRVSGRVASFRSTGVTPDHFGSVALDATGRMLATCLRSNAAGSLYLVSLEDLVSSRASRNESAFTPAHDCAGVALSGNGNVFAFGSSDTQLVTGDTNGQADVFALDLDTDHDGIPDDWETLYGLNPADPTDAALDADGDGKSNLEEYHASTHPRGAFTRYLAEGTNNSFFSTAIALYNPNSAPAHVLMRYLGDSGTIKTTDTMVPAKQQLRIFPAAPDPSFSTVVESDQFVAVERSMRWGLSSSGFYGSHAETAVAQPSVTWFFAEGATHGSFDLFYLLQNPNDAPATVTITYLLPAGQAPIVRDYIVAAHSRRTIYVDQEPGLGATDVSATMMSDVPILAERSMYFSTPDQPFAGGTGGAGLPQPSTQWFVAEGATGTFFDTFILIGNPSAQDADVTVTYLLEGGTSFDKHYLVAKQSRLTISVKGEDPRLASTSVSSAVKSTNDVPIVVERAMWWPSPTWYEGHLTAGTTGTAPAWVVADAPFGPFEDTHTYLLVANPSDTPAHVTFALTGIMSFNNTAATAPLTCNAPVDIAPHSRYTADVTVLCGFDGVLSYFLGSVGGVVSSDGPGIVVERSTYRSTTTQFWAAGESTALTRLPQ
jgi:hypothetical protein